MAARVRVIAGPAKSGKTAALLAEYRGSLRGGPIGGGLWIAPTHAAAAEIQSRLLCEGFAGCFSPGCRTFQQFAEAVLAHGGEAIRPIGRLLKRQLIACLVREAHAAGRLRHFGPIADRPGMIDLVDELISDLKRQEVWPEDFAEKIQKLGKRDKDRELAGLYAGYQELLQAHKLYDAEGRFWSARTVLKRLPKDRWGAFSALEHIVVDGFTDFTRTQHEILQLLAEHVSELSISLPLEQEPGREELFWKPRQTLGELADRHRGLEVEWHERPGGVVWPAMAHVERHLFRNPRLTPPADETARIEIVAASGQLAELQTLARRIKRLLLQGDPDESARPVRPQDVAVVFYSVDGASALVEEVFSEYGIPCRLASQPRLGHAPVLAAMMSVLRLAAEDWPFRQLLALLANNFFQPKWAQQQGESAAIAAEWAVRQLQLPRGRDDLLELLRRKADSLAPAKAEGERLDEVEQASGERKSARFAAAAEHLGRLKQTLQTLERRRTIAGWIAALQEVAEDLGFLAGGAGQPSPGGDADRGADRREDGGAEPSSSDVSDWTAFKQALASESTLDQWLDRPPAELTLAELIERLRDLLNVESLPAAAGPLGCVRVVSARDIRAIEVPYLFLAGLSEKAFPPPARDDRVYSESEYGRLNQAGLRFVDREQRASEEMLLFYEAVTRPTRRLVLSYPALDEAAQPLLPSPYVVELQRTLGPLMEATREITLNPVPQSDDLFSPTELRVKAVAEFADGSARRLKEFFGTAARFPAAGPLAAALEVAASRREREFGPFEGLLEGSAAQRLLGERYGPQHCWSVSRLEQYAYCPYRFFLTQALGLEELPELSLETDFGQRGNLAHETMAALHRRLIEQGIAAPSGMDRDEFTQLSSETLALLFERVPRGSRLDMALQTVDFRLIARWLLQYADQHERYDGSDSLEEPLRPAHFEVSFGLGGRRQSNDALSTEKPFELSCGDETVRLSGRIDRIDIGVVGGQAVFNVIDYKTGGRRRLKAADIEAGLALQLPLYAMAVQELLMVDRRAVPWRIGYWYLREKGYENAGLPACHQFDDELVETDDWRQLRGALLARVAEMVRGIRGGRFPVYSADDNCTSYCPYHTICRVGQIRSLNKVWNQDPPSLAEESDNKAGDQTK